MQPDTVIRKATSWAELFERVAATLFVIAFIAAPANAEPTILTGIVTHVRDGDTIEVGKDTDPTEWRICAGKESAPGDKQKLVITDLPDANNIEGDGSFSHLSLARESNG